MSDQCCGGEAVIQEEGSAQKKLWKGKRREEQVNLILVAWMGSKADREAGPLEKQEQAEGVCSFREPGPGTAKDF